MSDLLPLVLAAHLVGDWIVQTDEMAAGKVRPERRVVPSADGQRSLALYPDGAYWRSWVWNQYHMVTYHACLGLAFAGITQRQRVGFLAVSWVTHSVIDRRWPVRWLMEHTGSAAFAETSWGVMAVDQALHLSILCLLVAACR